MISKFIYTKVLGWKLTGNFPAELKKYVVIGAPHTSWKDFPIAILARNSWGVKINFIAKKSLFDPPFGFIFRWLGGAPVDRSKSNNRVDAIVDVFNNKEEFRLALSPEGTRKKVDKWKTGFYYIAKGANVPIVMFAFDFENKQIVLSEPYYTTNDQEGDFKVFYEFYKDVKGANPDQF
ncbi:1-acyl-sn-glycerol-3-phosphate acyltransferases [Tenacibaculum sp. MAR_2009_124]|uniref:1-acyl-sn-glycerol-3-phosphate acyltransferase n=1 Tax=Tenacibaculum sp. MAR_2009_124 TaxID=1250059 RepID=UPI000899E45C|nr:1-acyl-sn-glycerol-3-phosphate acyltransferase [Tenacibaculum sp. MAR_2009_124]SEB38229.1 1-acyl-sn-glycerol-3-phosphate acyltransferases [Tenacibaculum sp. MAR_2009_124]